MNDAQLMWHIQPKKFQSAVNIEGCDGWYDNRFQMPCKKTCHPLDKGLYALDTLEAVEQN